MVEVARKKCKKAGEKKQVFVYNGIPLFQIEDKTSTESWLEMGKMDEREWNWSCLCEQY
eukprot:jgi/Psemu1/39513/gm1.39513_g